MNLQFKIKRPVLFAFLYLILAQIILYFRYTAMGVNNIMTFELIMLFGVLLVCYSLQKWEDLINPISLYFIYIFSFGYSLLGLSSFSRSFDWQSVFIVVLSILAFTTGASLNYKLRSPFVLLRFDLKSNMVIYYCLFIFSFLCFLLEILSFGYLPILHVFQFDVYNETNERLVPFVHYFAMLFSVIPAWTYVLFKKGIFGKRWLIFIYSLSGFVILNYLSRQIILLFLLSSLITYTYYNKLNYKKIAYYTIGIILVFFLVGQVRLSQMESIRTDSEYTATQFLRNIAGIEYETNLVETTLELYGSIRYSEFDIMAGNAREDEYLGMGKFVLRPLISLTLLDRIGIVQYENDYNVSSALATYAIDPFLDFGYLGVILMGLIYGMVSTHFYQNYKQNNEKYILPWAIIVFCIIMTPFMNYFNTFFIFLIWITNKFIV